VDPRVAPLLEIVRLNTRLFRNCLEDWTGRQAAARPTPETNSAAYIALHLVDARYHLLSLLGAGRANSLASYTEDRDGMEDFVSYPGLLEIGDGWTDASRALEHRLGTLTAAELDEPLDTPFPVYDTTRLGVLGFLVQHDSYHIGQLALMRRFAGLPAMRYT
jgi:uncharacterized damage-inducible protein DinB